MSDRGLEKLSGRARRDQFLLAEDRVRCVQAGLLYRGVIVDLRHPDLHDDLTAGSAFRLTALTSAADRAEGNVLQVKWAMIQDHRRVGFGVNLRRGEKLIVSRVDFERVGEGVTFGDSIALDWDRERYRAWMDIVSENGNRERISQPLTLVHKLLIRETQSPYRLEDYASDAEAALDAPKHYGTALVDPSVDKLWKRLLKLTRAENTESPSGFLSNPYDPSSPPPSALTAWALYGAGEYRLEVLRKALPPKLHWQLTEMADMFAGFGYAQMQSEFEAFARKYAELGADVRTGNSFRGVLSGQRRQEGAERWREHARDLLPEAIAGLQRDRAKPKRRKGMVAGKPAPPILALSKQSIGLKIHDGWKLTDPQPPTPDTIARYLTHLVNCGYLSLETGDIDMSKLRDEPGSARD